MAQQRYDLRQEPGGSWTVFDVFTGLAADAWGAPAEGLDMGHADDLVGLRTALT
ncbi:MULTISPECIES: hypothetical protein [Mesorhizobium]|uniref:hypothetical protein n=1 Tax=Mesorhizobium TaxID=68287 RepID=UPI0002E833F9|nr:MULTISPECIES: hypothetical protein [Mesorhizobium]MDF3156607.1 hypothetical protein [Mesorhizobium sp. XAP10]MDF3249490.1 hypothetical protein [Mesorhizobium sp. XAP4]